ncbi:HAT repeat protein [Piedraia hortae CBS 480.64]|uniref:HAT repeat protein n=1 Tax=Piedraia hortae CBS 480.64 TaxID=1314780 RepID=A0A6A7BXS2_9PEZI|nr:HAT repeat protein [Piedraia hortae CBS 480.64]
MSGRKDFLSQPAPENYVAGLGRGATGFTTRSDLGPAREGPSEEQIKEVLAKRAAALGAAAPTAYGVKKKPEEADDDQFADAENEEGLLATGSYDKEDEEADQVYQAVDERMDRRRKGRREERERLEREQYERDHPKIQQQFADLKRSLGTLKDEDWANIPEVGDLTGKNRRSKQNEKKRFYAVPDSVLVGARDQGQLSTEVQDDGTATEAGREQADGTMTNFADIGKARNRAMEGRLDAAAQLQAAGGDSVAGTSTNIDPRGYLTSLGKSEAKAAEMQVHDIKRTRVLFESIIKSNPHHGPGWIGAARLEEFAGKPGAAMAVILRGAEQCPKDEDVWLEAMRLHAQHGNKRNAKVLAAKAVQAIDRSVNIWIEAMKLEENVAARKRVLRKALDHIPQSVTLWKEAVKLEDVESAKLMLAKATEMIPLSVELWLALARLETSEKAQVVLNKARKAIPTSYEIWIAAARLQEQTGATDMVFKIMARAVNALAKESAMLKHEEWIAQAEICEEEGADVTCQAIIFETLGWGLDESDDRKQIWLHDARASINRGRYKTAKAMYAHAARSLPADSSIWLAATELERQHGSKEALWALLEQAVQSCPNSEVLWLQLAREKWQGGQIDEARKVLGLAFQQNPGNEDIWLSAVKLEADNGEVEKARELLAEARSEAGTERIWIKSVAFERQIKDGSDEALALANEGLQLYPKAAKLWMMKGQIYEARNMLPQARDAYSMGTTKCPRSVPLWLLASRLEERAGTAIKARSILDRARLAVKRNPELWTEAVRLEIRNQKIAVAKQKMAVALQECPTSGLLLSERIWQLEERTQRKPRIHEAIKTVDTDPILFVTAARIFWGERKLDRADTWFQKAAVLDPDQGDTWAWWYRFALQHGTAEKREELISKCVANEPRHGEVWQRVRKAPENSHLNTEQVLAKVAGELG